MGFWDVFRRKKEKARESASQWEKGLEKTRTSFWSKIKRALGGRPKIDADFLEELEDILITADVGVDTVGYIIQRLEETVEREGGMTVEALYEHLYRIMGALLVVDQKSPWDEGVSSRKPFVIMVVGVNGAGKTTTIGKLAHWFKAQGKSVILGAADTFRAAAIDQLRTWAERADVPMVAHQPGADPGAVAFDTLQAAQARGIDVAIIDTAGRLHTKEPLMRELGKIRKVMKKVIPDAPHETWLVLDATTGQNALQQARRFSAVTPLTGLVVTKLDGTAKGGVVLSVAHEMGIPIRFVGLGEKIEDLRPFDAQSFITAFFDEKAMETTA